MEKKGAWFLGIHADPPRLLRYILAILPFLLLVVIYIIASDIRHKENPYDKLVPPISNIGKALQKTAFSKDKRTGDILLVKDTCASLKRLFTGISLAAASGFILGVNLGMMPGIRGLILPFIVFISNIPALAILPDLFILFGVGETGKIMLIFLGTFPLITRDVYLAAKQIPTETIVKALTLGASQKGVIYRVVMPMLIPKLIETIRLSLGAGWLFLIASEAIASQSGLGYRIFLVRRYLSMDIIITYVVWITLIAFIADFILKKWVAIRYPWYHEKEGV